MNKGESGTIYFLAGLLLGGLIGAGVGMLTAPESGDKTVAKLQKVGDKALKKSLKAINEYSKSELQPKIKEVKENLKTRVEEVARQMAPEPADLE
jgi:gas vesicle protein